MLKLSKLKIDQEFEAQISPPGFAVQSNIKK